jgi:translocator protein
MPNPSIKQQVIGFAVCIVFSFAAAAGAIFTSPIWYATLNKPAWSPSPSVFGPVWTTLYILIAISVWLVWRSGGLPSNQRAHQSWNKRSPQFRTLSVFLLQWIFNAAWTPVFFGAHRIDLALINILLLWISIVATMIAFARVKLLASLLLVPYLIWVSIATVLNFRLWQLN